jgi:monoamine oxidase
MSSVDVIVIGAGLAGLSAAQQLKERGASVRVLEARSRVGGRAHSERIESGRIQGAEQVIDLGAQFIGDAHVRLSALVDEVGLTRVPRNSEGKSVYLCSSEGKHVVVNGDDLPLSALGKLDAMQIDWRIGRRLRDLGVADAATLDRMTAAQYFRQLAFTDEAFRYVVGWIEAEFCVAADAFSAHEFLEQFASVGGRKGEAASAGWFLSEGISPLAHHLAGRLGSSVVLNAPVVSVRQDDNAVMVDTGAATYQARSLIVTTPPQLYRSMGLLQLMPDHRRQVIDGYRSGAVIKTVLVFDAPWWRDRGLSGSMLCPGGICNAAIDASPPRSKAGILVLFSTAESGRKLGQTTVEAERIDRVLAWLRCVTGGAVPAPIAARSVDWSIDSWSLGGYASRRGLGGWAAAPDLFAPIGRIHFAGTETATVWRAFMEGALQSAERAVEAVLAQR